VVTPSSNLYRALGFAHAFSSRSVWL
jgi:hypothetical protein